MAKRDENFRFTEATNCPTGEVFATLANGEELVQQDLLAHRRAVVGADGGGVITVTTDSEFYAVAAGGINAVLAQLPDPGPAPVAIIILLFDEEGRADFHLWHIDFSRGL